MAPRTVRPRSDRAPWPLAAGGAVVALVVGYAVARRVFDPDTHGHGGGGEQAGAAGAPDDAGAGAQGGAGANAAQQGASGGDAGGSGGAAAAASAQGAGAARAGVAVRVGRSVVQACGDGEEMNILGAQCGEVAGLDEALRRRLAAMGACPAAEAGARTPGAVLSLGLRIDFTRRRVTPLPGRSSTIANPLTYVACARAALDRVDELWTLQAPHPRYLYFFSVRFAPMEGAQAAGAAGAQAGEAGAGAGAGAANAQAPRGEAPQGGPAPQQRVATPGEGADAAAGGDGGAQEPLVVVPLASPEEAAVTWLRVNVRSAPRSGAIVASVQRGERVTLVGRAGGNWWQMRLPSGTGWIFGEAIGRR